MSPLTAQTESGWVNEYYKFVIVAPQASCIGKLFDGGVWVKGE